MKIKGMEIIGESGNYSAGRGKSCLPAQDCWNRKISFKGLLLHLGCQVVEGEGHLRLVPGPWGDRFARRHLQHHLLPPLHPSQQSRPQEESQVNRHRALVVFSNRDHCRVHRCGCDQPLRRGQDQAAGELLRTIHMMIITNKLHCRNWRRASAKRLILG